MANTEAGSPNNSEMQEKPSATFVRDFHTYADTDATSDSLHHTLGPGINQAAAGTHDHRGANSRLLFEGITLTGSKGGITAIQSICALLAQFGADDQTTP